MKQITCLITLIFISNFISAQNNDAIEKRFISVTGSAEVVVSPDEIELEITLKEYKTKKDTKVELVDIEKEFWAILSKNKIDQSNVVIGNSDYYWYYWWAYRNDNLKHKKYKVKLQSDTDFLALVKDLDVEGVSGLRISNSSNKQLQELRQDIKIAALKAAKEKATYLVESIDEKLGRVISIEEVPDNQNYFWRGNQNLLSNVVLSADSGGEPMEHVATIKLRYEVKTKFEIE